MVYLRSIPKSLPHIRQIVAWSTRRTSVERFQHSTDHILDFVDDLARNGVHGPIQFSPAQLRRLVTDSRFAFRCIQQRIRARRFPTNIQQIWPFMGLPYSDVSRDLCVSVSVLRNRVREEHMRWPNSSSAQHLLLAVQFSSLNQFFDRTFITVGRNLSFNGVHGVIRRRFDLHGQEAATEVHVEIKGRRYGPVQNSEQWHEVMAHSYNQHRINILLVLV